ncbi:MAG: bifunctional DNA primase/polymerase [Stellaceae bacterium]
MMKALAWTIGVRPNPNLLFKSAADETPQSMIGWALHWQARGLTIFPCKPFIGLPLVRSWPKEAACNNWKIVEWWSEQPRADIAAIPDAAGCFVIVAVGDQGFDTLDQIEPHCGEPVLETESADGSLHRWFPGRAPTQRLHHGLYVFGVGSYLYMPASLAPDPVARFAEAA